MFGYACGRAPTTGLPWHLLPYIGIEVAEAFEMGAQSSNALTVDLVPCTGARIVCESGS